MLYDSNDKIKISVIIPMYNIKEYIDECINSLLKQTFKEFEVICIDDCSIDGTYEKILEYSNSYDFINAYRNSENMGAGLCRNKGLQCARGKYVIFIDGDDICHEQMLEKLFIESEEKHADASFCNYIAYDQSTDKLKFEKKIKCEMTKVDLLKNPVYQSWNKLVLRNFLIKHNILFQNIPNSNDVYFSLMVITFADRFSIIDSGLYIYRQNRSGGLSLTHSKRTYLIFAFEAFLFELKQRNYCKGKLKESILNLIIGQSYVFALNLNLRDVVRKDFQKKIPPLLSDEDETLIFQNKWMKYQYCYLIGNEKNEKNIYQLYKEEIIGWFNQYEQRKIVLWGAGRLGEKFLDALAKEADKIAYIIDNDINKQGKRIRGIPIYSFDEKMKEIDVILVLNPRFWEEIKEQVEESALVIDMNNVIESF